MTGKAASQQGKFSRLRLSAGGKSFVAVSLVLLFVMLPGIQPGYAVQAPPQPIGSMPPPQQNPPNTAPTVPAGTNCPSNPTGAGPPCEAPGAASLAATPMIGDLLEDLVQVASQLEIWLYQNTLQILQSEYNQIDWLEKQMQSWWGTLWYYNLLPSYHQETKQLNVALAQQSLLLHETADASAMQETDRALAKHAIDEQGMQPAEQVCVAATSVGGFTRATSIGRIMRQAWEVKSVAAGLNEKTDPDGKPYPGATSAGGTDQVRYDDWQNIFCDPMGNSVSNVNCGKKIDVNLTNADVLPVKFLFNNLTISVDDKTAAANGNTEGQNLELGIEYLINNLVGLPARDASVQSALSSPPGQESYLKFRSYLARYAAVRSVPDMVAGWRMPGSQMGKWVADLRESGGVTANVLQDTNNNSAGFYRPDSGIALVGGISQNPSYKEIMHALSIDRFNSGRYANQMITDPAKVDLEKLDISVLYLMQLRDYYELLERTALTLSVQVSILADQQRMPVPTSASPTGPAPPPPG